MCARCGQPGRLRRADGRARGTSGGRREGAAAAAGGAMGILEKISEIEKEIARTQKNKGGGAGG